METGEGFVQNIKVPIRGLGILHISNIQILMRKIATYLVSRKIHLHILFCY